MQLKASYIKKVKKKSEEDQNLCHQELNTQLANQWRNRRTSSGKRNFQKDEIVAHKI